MAISTPSGDVHGAEEAVALVAALAPSEATIERVPCSSPDHAPDLILRLTGSGARRLLLLGHLDTVVAHDEHRSLTREGEQLAGLGRDRHEGRRRARARRPARPRHARGAFAEVALLLVCDEEWRVGPFVHVPRFAGFDACLCFEAGQLADDDLEAVVVRRKAAGTLSVTAHGRSAHSGSAPDKGINALLALASAAQAVAGSQDPHGPPAPDRGADRAARRRRLQRRSRHRRAGVRPARRQPRRLRGRPAGAAGRAGRRAPRGPARAPVAGDGRARGHRAAACGGGRRARAAGHRSGRAAAPATRPTSRPPIPFTVDGLGPRGGGAHAPHEYLLATSLKPRAEVALAVADAALNV